MGAEGATVLRAEDIFQEFVANDGLTINKGILSEVNYKRILIKGVSFKRNCGAASLGEYNRVIKYHQLS